MRDSLERICAMLLRHAYILRGSTSRLVEIFYWPSVQVVLWGFIGRYFSVSQATPLNVALGIFLGGVILWDFLFRSQIGVSFTYLEEIWSRNIGHLFISPLRPWEWWLSMVLFSACRATMGMIPAALIAIPFYGFSLFDLGLPLLFFFFNLMIMGWWLGLFIMSILIKAGPSAESLAWALTFLLAPVSAVYYPVSLLPQWLQPVSAMLPSSHVFEGLRALVIHQTFDAREMWLALGLNGVYMALALMLLNFSLNNARREGTLLQTGE
jgi:ABC-2 type transport system permease protein